MQRNDTIKWICLDKTELLDNIMINPECISVGTKMESNSKEGVTLRKIKQEITNYERRLKELIIFIQETHLYYGKTSLQYNIMTIVPGFDYDPIFSPKNLKSLLNGLDFGLQYIIMTNANGTCPFLELNHCLIHEIKPLDCKLFPHNEDGSLRRDYPFISICSGLKKIQEYNLRR